MGPGLLAPTHIIMLALVALLIFGPKRLPEIARSLGHGLREFKESVTGDHGDDAALEDRSQISGRSEVTHGRERDTI
jgi:sec-independent protein translocase protein TatA